MTQNLHFLEMTELAERLRRREVSAVEVTRAQLQRIASLDPDLASFACLTAEQALEAAAAADAEMASGLYRGPLHGVPLGIKDLFWVEGVPTAAGTAIHRDFRPKADATVVRRLREAGAVMLGKLKMTEGAYSDHHPSVSPPVNPWNAGYWTGISSSGPGVALAAGLCFGALASDTGGSIRWPCSANGLTGLKPTWGRVSRHGMFALAPSMDHVGPMARSAADVALLFDAIAGPDPDDPTALQAPVSRAASSLAGVTIAVDPVWNEHDVDPQVRAVVAGAAAVLADLGATIVDVTAPDVTDAVADWPDLCAAEAALAHEATYPSRRDEYGPVLAAVIARGRSFTATDLQRIHLRRMTLCGAFDELFARVDLLLCPVQPFEPVSLETLGVMGEHPEMIAKLQRFTCPFDMTGSPTITLPGGCDALGMPIGFQLAGGRLREDLLLGAGTAFQRSTSWHRRHPDCRKEL